MNQIGNYNKWTIVYIIKEKGILSDYINTEFFVLVTTLELFKNSFMQM